MADAVTLYAWRGPGLRVTRWAAAVSLPTPALIIAETLLSLLVFTLFWHGRYWPGLGTAATVMILSVSSLVLERSAGSGAAPRRLRQGAEIVLPLLWWWAWEHGLAAYGRPLEPVYATMVLWVVIGGTLAVNIIEALARHRFNGMEIHAWRPLDSRFRLVGAGRNTNLLILAVSLLLRRPDSGFVLVAWWTLISLIFHAVRLAQLTERQARRQKITSWLDE